MEVMYKCGCIASGTSIPARCYKHGETTILYGITNTAIKDECDEYERLNSTADLEDDHNGQQSNLF